MSAQIDILLLGATGVSGRETAKYLAAHPDLSSFTFAIAGRSKSKLDRLVAELSLPATIPVLQVDVTNPEDVEQAVKRARVVINTVGPYRIWGTPVVKACVAHGVHYVDLTGETTWIKEIITTFDYTAHKKEVLVVPSCGFDSVPSDLSVFMARQTFNESATPASTERIDIADSLTAFKVKGVFSGGTFATLIDSMEQAALGRNTLGRNLSPVEGYVPPHPKLLYELEIPDRPKKPVIGGFWFMSSANNAIVQRSWGLREQQALIKDSAENTAKAEKARYGPKFHYDEFLVMPSRWMAVVMSVGFLLGFASLYFRPIRWLAKRFGPQSGDGPSEAEMKSGSFVTTNISTSAPTASNPVPKQVKTTFRGRGDPGYLLSPFMLAESALCIVLSRDSLPEMGQKGGVLTPMTAFGDVLVERLKRTRYFDVESVLIDGESRKTI